MPTLPPSDADTTTPTPPAEVHVYCPHCGYDMRARFGDTCPECGQLVTDEAMRRAQIPWSNRKDLGRLSALYRTFWRVTVKPKLFAQAVSQPVDLAEAKRFHSVIVTLVWLTFIVAMGLWFYTVTDEYDRENLYAQFHWWPAAVAVLFATAAWFTIYAMTAVHSYWFHPRHLDVEQQNRAVALSYYACAPLLLIPMSVVPIFVGIALVTLGDRLAQGALNVIGSVVILLFGVVVVLAAIADVWLTAARQAKQTAGRGTMVQALLALGLPLIWLCILFLGLSIPAGLVYAAIMLGTMS